MPKVEPPRQQLRFSAGHARNASAPPTGGSQQPHTAPRTSNETNRCTREPNTGTATAEDAAPTPGPPRSHNHTQEHATIDWAPAAPPRRTQHSARVTPIYRLTPRPTPSKRGPHPANLIATTTPTCSPHPKASTKANLSVRGQAAHLQPICPCYSFAHDGSRDNRGGPGDRHPETATPRATPRDTGAQAPPRRT